MANMKKSKTDKTPKRKMPEGFEFPRNKRAVPNPPGTPRPQAPSRKKPLPKMEGAKPGARRLLPKDIKSTPSPRRLLANTTTSASGRTAPKPKVAKRAPLKTKRIGGIFAVPANPKKTIY